MKVGDPVRSGHHHRGQSRDNAAVGADIGPHVAVDRGAQSQQCAVVAGRDLHLAQHLPGVVGRGQVFYPVLHPLHRASQPEGCEGDEKVLCVELASYTKATAHIGLDEVDALFLDLQVAGQYRPVGVGHLGGAPDSHCGRRRCRSLRRAPGSPWDWRLWRLVRNSSLRVYPASRKAASTSPTFISAEPGQGCCHCRDGRSPSLTGLPTRLSLMLEARSQHR